MNKINEFDLLAITSGKHHFHAHEFKHKKHEVQNTGGGLLGSSVDLKLINNTQNPIEIIIFQ